MLCAEKRRVMEEWISAFKIAASSIARTHVSLFTYLSFLTLRIVKSGWGSYPFYICITSCSYVLLNLGVNLLDLQGGEEQKMLIKG